MRAELLKPSMDALIRSSRAAAAAPAARDTGAAAATRRANAAALSHVLKRQSSDDRARSAAADAPRGGAEARAGAASDDAARAPKPRNLLDAIHSARRTSSGEGCASRDGSAPEQRAGKFFNLLDGLPAAPAAAAHGAGAGAQGAWQLGAGAAAAAKEEATLLGEPSLGGAGWAAQREPVGAMPSEEADTETTAAQVRLP